MLRAHSTTIATGTVLLSCFASAALGQAYPAKPVRIVVPFLTGNRICNRFAQFMRSWSISTAGVEAKTRYVVSLACRHRAVIYGPEAFVPGRFVLSASTTFSASG